MSNIKKELFSGVFYTAIAKYSGIAISLVITGVLSRLLTAGDFGIVAIATVIISFFNMFTDVGVSSAIIQKKDLTASDLSNIFSFTLWTGILISLLFFICSWPIGHYYQNDVLITLCQLLSVNLFFASVNVVPNALFYKHKEFKFIAIRTLSIQFIAGTVAILVALNGGGLYALVVNPVLSSALLFFISIKRYPQKIRLSLGVDSVHKIFSYSMYQFLFNVINYFSRNLDKLLIGKYMQMSDLGYYEKSYRTMMLPLQNITHVITPVMHPVFSEYQNALDKLIVSYEKIVRLFAFIGFPLSVCCYFTSGEIISILYGDNWEASVPVFRILSLSIGLQIILSSSGSFFQSANDTKSMFVSGFFSAILNVLGIVLGIFVFKSLVAIAYCICVTFTINFVQCYWIMYRITIKRSLFCFFRQLFSPLLLSTFLFIGLYCLSLIVSGFHPFISLFIKSFFALIASCCYIQMSKAYDILKKIRQVMKRDLKK